MEPILGHLRSREDALVTDLAAWVRIPSVSADPAHAADVRAAAEWLQRRLERAGLENVGLIETDGAPTVVADWLHSDGPTVLIYGHYDVQPAIAADGWTTEPFSGDVRDGCVWGRGASDDKGQVLCHVEAVEAYIRHGGPPVNIRFVIEGEEEIGSQNFAVVLDELRKGPIDHIIVSDGVMQDPDTPAITLGLRGLVYMEATLTGPSHDLHSGVFGGAVRNPNEALAHLLASLKDPKTGRIQVPGFYEAVLDAPEGLSYPEDDEIIKQSGVPELWGEKGFAGGERLSVRPTLEVNGMWGGYIGPGSKTVIPHVARAKLSCRLVPDQDPYAIAEALAAALQERAPQGTRVEVGGFHHAWPIQVPKENPVLLAVAAALHQAYGKPASFIWEGGTIPALGLMQRKCGIDPIMVGFGCRDDGMHGPDEFVRIQGLHLGARASAAILAALGASQTD